MMSWITQRKTKEEQWNNPFYDYDIFIQQTTKPQQQQQLI